MDKKWPWYYPLEKGYAWCSPKYSFGYITVDRNHQCKYLNVKFYTKLKWAFEVILSPKQWILKYKGLDLKK